MRLVNDLEKPPGKGQISIPLDIDSEARKFPFKYMQAIVFFESSKTQIEGLQILYSLLRQVETTSDSVETLTQNATQIQKETMSLFGLFPIDKNSKALMI